MIEKQKQTIRKLEIDLGEKTIKKSQEEMDLEKKYGMAMEKLSTMSDELVKYLIYNLGPTRKSLL